MIKYLLISLLMLLATVAVRAQDSLNVDGRHYVFLGVTDTAKANGNTYIIKYVEVPEMAYFMRSNGKIYVVVLVLATIFAGIFAYLLLLNRKIGRLEKEKVA